MLHSYQVENSHESSLLNINVFLGWIKIYTDVSPITTRCKHGGFSYRWYIYVDVYPVNKCVSLDIITSVILL